MSSSELKRIALLTDGFFPNVIGGMQKHSYYLAKYLAKAGIRVDLYYPFVKGEVADTSLFDESEKQWIRFIGVPYPDVTTHAGHYIRESYEFSRRVFKKFRESDNVDFIIAKGFSGWELINMKMKGERLPPVGVNFHGYEMFQRQPGFIAWLKSKLLLVSPVKFNIKHADYVFSYGGKISGIITGLGVSADRVIEIPAGIPEYWLSDRPSGNNAVRKFIFVGRFERRKGIEELNSVLRNLIASRSSFTIDFIGEIPTGKKISSDKVHYHGAVRDESVLRDLLKSADVLVCPSHSEGMPNVIMEAMASGLAVIATDVGATSEIVSSSNGWLLSQVSVAALERSMTDAIACGDTELTKKKEHSLEKARTLRWTSIAEKTITALQGCVQKLGL